MNCLHAFAYTSNPIYWGSRMDQEQWCEHNRFPSSLTEFEVKETTGRPCIEADAKQARVNGARGGRLAPASRLIFSIRLVFEKVTFQLRSKGGEGFGSIQVKGGRWRIPERWAMCVVQAKCEEPVWGWGYCVSYRPTWRIWVSFIIFLFMCTSPFSYLSIYWSIIDLQYYISFRCTA